MARKRNVGNNGPDPQIPVTLCMYFSLDAADFGYNGLVLPISLKTIIVRFCYMISLCVFFTDCSRSKSVVVV